MLAGSRCGSSRHASHRCSLQRCTHTHSNKSAACITWKYTRKKRYFARTITISFSVVLYIPGFSLRPEVYQLALLHGALQPLSLCGQSRLLLKGTVSFGITLGLHTAYHQCLLPSLFLLTNNHDAFRPVMSYKMSMSACASFSMLKLMLPQCYILVLL